MKHCPKCNYANPDERSTCLQCGAELQQPVGEDPFVERLRREVQEWEGQGLIRSEQAQTLLARYGLVPGETAVTVRRSKIVSVLAVLGVILVAVGVILVIGSNWQTLPKWCRLGILMAATASAYLFGYSLAYQRRTYPKVGMALLLLGSLLWGASIFLVGQMYHLGGGGGERTALLCWFAGVLPLAYIFSSPLHMGLSLVIGTIWFFLKVGPIFEAVPQAAFLLILTLGVMLYAAGCLHPASATMRSVGTVYRSFGLVYIFAALYAFSFRYFWGPYSSIFYRGAHWDFEGVLAWPGVAALAFVTAIAAFALAQARRDRIVSYEALGVFALLVVGALAAWATFFGHRADVHPVASYTEPRVVGLAVLFNVILLAAEIGVIALGWLRSSDGLMNLGVAIFGLQVITRYFDVLWSMFRGGMFFIVTGLLVIATAVLIERGRRKLLEAARTRRFA